MVLRKPLPPGIEAPDRGDGRSASTTVAASSPSSSTRFPRGRAHSASQAPQSSAPQSVYSPDLNTSPAFDLMTLDQAQRSPVGAPFNEPQNPWAEELVEKPEQDAKLPTSQTDASPAAQEGPAAENKTGLHRVPPIVTESTQRRRAAEGLQSDLPYGTSPSHTRAESAPQQLQSNNPFLRTRQEYNPWEDSAPQIAPTEGPSQLAPAGNNRGQGYAGHRVSESEGFIPMTARLSLFDEPAHESPWGEQPGSSERPPSQPLQANLPPQPVGEDPGAVWSPETFDSMPHAVNLPDGPLYDPHAEPQGPISSADTPGVGANRDAYSTVQGKQPDYGAHCAESWTNIPSATVSNATRNSSQDLLDFDDDAPVSSQLQAGAYQTTPVQKPSIDNGLPHHDAVSPRNQQPSLLDSGPSEKPAAPPMPPRPQAAAAPSGAEAREKEKRAETYAIRHINWTDSTGKLRESPVLVQNENGPCPLLALVNSLVLRADRNAGTPIVKALQTREQISLGLLIQALFDELTTCLAPDEELPDIEALSRFLTMLDTGMNVNPRLTVESEHAAGSFYETNDIRLYGTFKVPLIHGWLASPSSEVHTALTRVAQYHEDIQLLQFRKEEIEDRVCRGGSVTPEEEQLMNDIHSILYFVDVENTTQLSVFGLDHLTARLAPGSISILFRNDHFSTLYKHPKWHRLFTLVTDAGYANHAEVVWESLVDVNGFNTEFFSGDFRPVGHAPSGSTSRGHTAARSDASRRSGQQHHGSPSQEQTDADYAYALSLQFQEEAQRESDDTPGNQRRASAPLHTHVQATGRGVHNRSSSSISGGRPAGRGHATSRSQDNRPHIPRRNYAAAVNRPVDGADEAPPPSYEQAANGPAYVPPPGSPHHEMSSSSLNLSPPYLPDQDVRRTRSQLGRRPPGATISTGTPERSKDKNKDCIVM
ncbi:DUF455 domain protein [Paecilomyces variotii No. 5]|uniref:DUF455 domain protein n=1 Tax=Byssochlamys spectabilis (strain No. 5 / NBRC 109023) TaxID=1356009 RepID=V5I615_BYSSN|nr:DUF455 domain protein [Paecilomyces variotii No. 5]